MSPQQIFIALKARYRIIILVTLVTAIVACIACLALPDRYRATVGVVVDVRYADPVAGGYLPGLTQPSYMATQIDILQSDRVADGVVRELKLDKNPNYIARWKDQTDGKGSLVSWIGDIMQGKLDVVPAKDSNVISITCKKNGNAAEAAACANAFAKVYIDTSLSLRVEPARSYIAFFEGQAATARASLEKAQKALSDYQQQKGIPDTTDARYDTELTRMAELSSQLSTVQGLKFDTTSRGQQAKTSGDSIQEVLQHPLVTSLKAELSRQEAKLSELGANLGTNHPQYQAVQEQVNSVRRQLNAQIGLITRGVATSDRVNDQRVAELQAALDAQKARVLKLKEDKDGIAVLQRDVDFAQRAADMVAQRRNQSTLESQATQTNISVLSPATEPPEPYFPKIGLLAPIGLFVGLVLGTAIALAMEFLDRRVRSSADLAALLGMPVLGVVSNEYRSIGQRSRRRLAGRGNIRQLPGAAPSGA